MEKKINKKQREKVETTPNMKVEKEVQWEIGIKKQMKKWTEKEVLKNIEQTLKREQRS